MKKFSCALLAVIIGSLCFSVGEGLRLTPFPVSELTPAAETNASEKTSLSHYGPLDVPAQAQKRSKRQALDLAGPVSTGTRKFVTSICYLYEDEIVAAGSLLFVPRPEGRAPPSLS